MKSSYELALARLNKTAPAIKLTAGQKAQIAELESKFKARIAEREITLKGEITKAASAGDFKMVEQLQQQLVMECKKLRDELEDKRAAARQGKS
jgi:hypothetical protein